MQAGAQEERVRTRAKQPSTAGTIFEIIERTGEAGFQDQNVQALFESLEKKGSF